jgi:hypothetical protein
MTDTINTITKDTKNVVTDGEVIADMVTVAAMVMATVMGTENIRVPFI